MPQVVDVVQDTGGSGSGSGQFNIVRYRGQSWIAGNSVLTGIQLKLNSVGSMGLKFFIYAADSSGLPTGSELYSFTVPNASLNTSYTRYNLPVYLPLTVGNRYCWYVAPWDTGTDSYSDDYRDLDATLTNPYANGVAIVNVNGSWSQSDLGTLDMRFEIWGNNDVPSVSDSGASSVSEASAIGNGSVDSDGGNAITQRGFVWGLSINPTTADSKVTVAGTVGGFSGTMSGLAQATTYHYRAYAINSAGTSYGADQSFTTDILTIPAIPFATDGRTNSQDSKYTLEIQDKNGTLLAEFTGKASSRRMSFVRNGVYTATWQINIDDLEAYARRSKQHPRSILSVGRNQVIIKRLGVPVFGGRIIYYEGSVSTDKTLTINCVGWLELLNNRFTGASRVFTATDAGQIAKTLIDETQALTNGSFGIITSGTIQTSVNRDRTYSYKNIKDAIIELSQVNNGFDFEITWDKRFLVYYPKIGKTRTEFAFEYPGNIASFRVSDDAKNLANQVIVRGQGFVNAGALVRVRDDLVAQSQYDLRQLIQDESSVIETQTLDDHGDATLSVKKVPIEILSIVLDGNQPPAFGSYWLGDRVQTSIQNLRLYDNISGTYRIDQIDIDIDNNDSEKISLKLTL